MMSNPYDFVDWLNKKDRLTQIRIILRSIYVILYELVLIVILPTIFVQYNTYLALGWLIATIGYITRKHTFFKGKGKEFLPYKPVDDEDYEDEDL